MSRILLFNKPYGVICQFSRDGLHSTLADYIALPGFYLPGVWTSRAKDCCC